MRLFQIQRISAIALVVLLTIHMVVVHYPPFHIDFSIILMRMANPIWKIIDILFLFFVLIHALGGTYAVILDYEKLTEYKKLLLGVIIIVGGWAFIWGALTIWSFQPTM